MTPRRIQRSRVRGWRAPEGVIYVGRPTVWGNPFVVGRDSGIFPNHNEIMLPAIDLPTSLRLYRDLIGGLLMPEMVPYGHDWYFRFRRSMSEHPTEAARSILRGHDLMCWCPLDRPCHADVLLEIASPPAPGLSDVP